MDYRCLQQDMRHYYCYSTSCVWTLQFEPGSFTLKNKRGSVKGGGLAFWNIQFHYDSDRDPALKKKGSTRDRN